MTTPICDFVGNYAAGRMIRAHMPGHKGRTIGECGFGSAYLYDITEIGGADYLFDADGIIAESEKNASRLFHTAGTIYSAAGSTACIQAMLSTVCRPGDTVAAARNSHTAFINACALLGLDVEWIYPENGGFVSGDYSPETVERVLRRKNVSCVYMTSPDYLGHMNDIKGIAEICRRYSTKLLCDNAHGAYTAFLEQPLHPIAIGADMCCDSAHKTLPVLTGGAYLHSSEAYLAEKAKKNMAMFCSTSPSYLIMQSLDLCNRFLENEFPGKLKATVSHISEIKAHLREKWNVPECEPLKIVINSPENGYTGTELASVLRKNGAECEYADYYNVVLMLSVCNTADELDMLEKILTDIPERRPLEYDHTPLNVHLEKAADIRSAVFAENEFIPADEIERAIGKICGKAVCCCPPGIAAVVPGEIISSDTAAVIRKYRLAGVNVVKG